MSSALALMCPFASRLESPWILGRATCSDWTRRSPRPLLPKWRDIKVAGGRGVARAEPMPAPRTRVGPPNPAPARSERLAPRLLRGRPASQFDRLDLPPGRSGPPGDAVRLDADSAGISKQQSDGRPHSAVVPTKEPSMARSTRVLHLSPVGPVVLSTSPTPIQPQQELMHQLDSAGVAFEATNCTPICSATRSKLLLGKVVRR